jgi:endoglucanase
LRKLLIFLSSLILFFLSANIVSASSYVRGLNLFGGWQGQYGGVDTFPNGKLLDYYKSKGLTTFRVGFSWLHLQPSLNEPLDLTYLSKMDTLVANAKARGEKVAFVPLPGNYNGNDVATSAVPQSAFNDMWVKLASHYKDETAIWGYDLINEPNMGDTWNTNIAPSVISAIRTVDMIHPIITPTSTGGYGHFFTSHLVGLPMNDPANNLIYEAHFYFDSPPNGQYPNGFDVPNGDLNIGVERAQGFVNWCVSNNEKCFAGEYGIPGGWTHGDTLCVYNGGSNNDPRWLTVLDNFLSYLDQNGISGTYWESGPYGDINSAGPFCDANSNYIDGPQIAILTKHLGTKNGDANADGKVDGIDYVIWLIHYGQNVVNGSASGDFNADGKVDGIDYVIWLDNY